MEFARRIAALVAALNALVPLSALLSILRASYPLPKKPEDVRPWLTRIGIADPIQSAVAPALEKLLSGLSVLPVVGAAEPADAAIVAGDAVDELVAAGKITPAERETAVELIQFAMQEFPVG
jgi:hypothetical protein